MSPRGEIAFPVPQLKTLRHVVSTAALGAIFAITNISASATKHGGIPFLALSDMGQARHPRWGRFASCAPASDLLPLSSRFCKNISIFIDGKSPEFTGIPSR
jgi:hypothetical protein